MSEENQVERIPPKGGSSSAPPRSILDGVPIVTTPEYDRLVGAKRGGEPLLAIVSHCPRCGSPIYGHSMVTAKETAVIKRTCTCGGGADKSLSFRETMETK